MEDIRRHDARLFWQVLLRPSRLLLSVFLEFISLGIFFGSHGPAFFFFMSLVVPIAHFAFSYKEFKKRQFANKRFEQMWLGCRDRLTRLEQVLSRLRRDQRIDLQEMPATLRRVAFSLYDALRRADIVAAEIESSEHGILHHPPSWQSGSGDAQARELYRIADKNIAEYRSRMQGVVGGVHRIEAQAAVYMTTVDSLRVRLLSYRIVGRSPELSSQEFLTAMAEAKIQLQAIDTALDELDLSGYPQMIAVQPPPIPEDIRKNLGQGP